MLMLVLFLSMLRYIAAEYQVLNKHTETLNYNYTSSNNECNRIIFEKLNFLTTAEKILCFKIDAFIEKVDQQFTRQENAIKNIYESLNRNIKTMFEKLQNSTTPHDSAESLCSITTSCQNISAANTPKLIKYPGNCAEAVGPNGKSGLYKIQIPDTAIRPFFIYCEVDPDGGPAWTIVQRRTDGSMDFFLNWQDYKYGFGNLENEYFIGLEKLHELTTSRLQELWIKMGDLENVVKHARYDKFAIGDENQAYALNVLGKYSGSAGDSLTVHAGQKFSTKDAKNDNNPNENCAQSYRGAWWYHGCHQSNLNGLYLRGSYGDDKFAQGINWYTWHGHFYSLMYTHMAIRPVSVN